MKEINKRKTSYDIDDIFLNRYSPRALSGESISQEELFTVFEAARWAPSASNIQPWRFIYAHRDTPSFEKLFSLLVEGNQIWCKNASVLVVIVSNKNNDKGDPSPTHSFDTGSAWENLALQCTKMGLITHGMGGFDYIKAKNDLNIPEDFNVEAMVAIGKPGNIEDLPEKLQSREEPSGRKNLEEIIFEGEFKKA